MKTNQDIDIVFVCIYVCTDLLFLFCNSIKKGLQCDNISLFHFTGELESKASSVKVTAVYTQQ